MKKYVGFGAAAFSFLLLAHCVSDASDTFVVPPTDGSAEGSSNSLDGSSQPNGEDGGNGSQKDAPTPTPCQPNPLNFDVPGNNCDDDGDGTIDNTPTCDSALNSSGDAEAFARALGVCGSASPTRWGLVSANYTAGYGAPGSPNDAQHAILPKFGNIVHPLEGVSLGVLSSGFAAEYDDATDAGTSFDNGAQMQGGATDSLPAGFPVAAPGCQISSKAYDTIDVALRLQVPANATKLSVSFDFHSSEWPVFVCSSFNDTFIIYYQAAGGAAGVNIAYDANSHPINVNSAFIDRCTNGVPETCEESGGTAALFPCGSGPSELAGTGFGLPLAQGCLDGGTTTSGAASGWRAATIAVKGGDTISLDFIISDIGDTFLDSTVLLDNLHWEN